MRAVSDEATGFGDSTCAVPKSGSPLFCLLDRETHALNAKDG
jgi:hypothetical protein